MKGFDTLHIKSAVKSRNKFDLSRTHLTTGEFGQIVPLLNEETVPGDKFNINANYFSRMAPLVKPTYGKFSFNTLAGFVPYYQIADDAEAFIAGKQTWEGSTPTLRKISLRALLEFVVTYCCTTTGASATNYDVFAYNSSGTGTYYLFTNKGRYWVKVLNALGYVIPEQGNLKSTSTWYTTQGAIIMSAMPLLAFFKLYNDWMSQSQRYNTSALTYFLKNIKHGIAVTGKFNSPSFALTASGIKELFDNLYLSYANDYFTSAWQNPTSPLGAQEGIDTLSVPGGRLGTKDFVQSIADDSNLFAETETISGTTYARIGQRALDFLKSFDDWVRRNNYSGSRTVQNVYSRFGIKTSDFRDNYAEVIKTDFSPIQVGDVTSQSDATGAVLGDYAGKGIMSDGKSIAYQANDYGMLFILGWFTVAPMNAFGASKSVLRTQPFDFYTPEFDGIGAEPISYLETYEDPTVVSGDSSTQDMTFGFTERYNSYSL